MNRIDTQKNTRKSISCAPFLFVNLCVFSIIFLFSCSQKVTAPAAGEKLSAEYLAQGKTIFENSCGKCHDLPAPADHDAEQWVGIMNWMAPKARLNDAQQRMVYDYIISVKP